MDQDNQQPRPRVSRSFIFSIIIVAAIIALIAYFIFSGGSSAKTISTEDFVNKLYNGNVTEVQLVSGSTVVTVNGKAKELDSNGKEVKYSFALNIDRDVFDSKLNYNLDLDGDSNVDLCNIPEIIR